VGGAGDGGKEKTARRWMGGAVAGSISVVAEAAEAAGARAAGVLLQLDGFQLHKAINRRTRTSGGPT